MRLYYSMPIVHRNSLTKHKINCYDIYMLIGEVTYIRRDYIQTQEFWDELKSYRVLFTEEEYRYIESISKTMKGGETEKELKLSRRTIWYHQRNIYFKWTEYLLEMILHEIGYEGNLSRRSILNHIHSIQKVLRDIHEVREEFEHD